MKKSGSDDLDIYIGNRVRMRRKMLRITQQELGKKLGLTFQHVQKYERGTNRISASTLQKLSQILEAPIDFFYDQALQPEKTTASTNFGMLIEFLGQPLGLRLIEALSCIKDHKTRKKVVELVEAISTINRA